MVGFCFPNVDTVEEFNKNLKSGPNGLKLDYFRLRSPDDDPLYVLLALNLEMSRSVRTVADFKHAPSTTKIIRIVKSVGFEFDKMIRDQYQSGLTVRDLRRIHGIGNKTILDILKKMNVAVPDGNTKRGVTKEQIAEAYERFGGNYSRIGMHIGMHRVTVSKKVKEFDIK